MKTGNLILVLVLVALAAFLILRQSDFVGNREEENTPAVTKSGSSSGGFGRHNEREGRGVTKSDRKESKKTPIVTTESGLQYKVLVEGEGESPGPTSKVEVHYVGTFEDGTVFDSSRERGEPAKFPLNGVIKGWTEGLQLMKPGALYRFVIPPELAYGSSKRSSIPANSTLTFEVELISITDP